MKINPFNTSSAPARRRFMSAAGAVCVGAAASVASAGDTAGTAVKFARSMRGSPLEAGRFRACIGSVFHVRSLTRGALPIPLTLAQVVPSPFKTVRGSTNENAFSIDLTGAAASLSQDTYLVSHPDMGEFVALLVPAGDRRTLVGVFDIAA